VELKAVAEVKGGLLHDKL